MEEDYHALLSRCQMKLTRQRRIILEVITSLAGEHPTAEEIYQEVNKIMPEIGQATIYRSLDLFVRHNLIHKSHLKDGKYRYELFDKNQHFHHHFVCRKCGEISEIKEDLLQQLEADLESKGFQVEDHHLSFYGYCPNCR